MTIHLDTDPRRIRDFTDALNEESARLRRLGIRAGDDTRGARRAEARPQVTLRPGGTRQGREPGAAPPPRENTR